ncbi:MAG: hypothetical protein HUJ70_04280 [Pseudobutyrivibrio sp.]|nr:hypothetical protein [Pseudobutyrivibrio sp.]
MSAEFNIRKTTGVTGGYVHRTVSQRPPIDHPKNCREECCYGYNRAYCFPCYKKLMAEMAENKRS